MDKTLMILPPPPFHLKVNNLNVNINHLVHSVYMVDY